MSLLVVGSVAFDAVETPFGKRDRMLGGSASHFSISASFFTDVRVVAVVGGDFGNEELNVFKQHNVDTADLEVIPDGKTFRWFGKYEYDLNVAHTLDTHLNVFAGFQPKLSDRSKQSRLVFLGNIQPDLQRGIEVVDLLIVNDAEARQLSEEPNMIKAARKILSWGPSTLIVKRGEYGAAMFTKDEYFAIPAYPLESVFDPTGAGDTFAGGLMGYLASQQKLDEAALRRAMIFGSVMASFNVEEFGTERVQRLTPDEINQRFRDFKRFTHFEEIPFERAAASVK